jgi:hypothetical protein
MARMGVSVKEVSLAEAGSEEDGYRGLTPRLT